MSKIIFVIFMTIFLLSCNLDNIGTVTKEDLSNNTGVTNKENRLDNIGKVNNPYNLDEILNRTIELTDNDLNVISSFNGNKNYCLNNKSYICKLINNNYFYDKYFTTCKSYNDISKCDSLTGEQINFCKGDFYIKELIEKKDINVCNNFGNNFDYGKIMGGDIYNNKKFCSIFYKSIVSKDNINIDDINKFTINIGAESTVYNQLVNIFLYDSNINNVKDLFEIKMRKGLLNCDNLKDINYIFTILSELN